jgi:hypothetical protein
LYAVGRHHEYALEVLELAQKHGDELGAVKVKGASLQEDIGLIDKNYL